MPQMSPMLWSLLFIYFIFLFLLFNVLNYFNVFKYLNPSMKTNSTEEKSFNKNSLNWKW